MIYVYAVAEVGTPTPRDPGIDGAQVERLIEGSLAAFFSPDPPGRIEPGERALWQHEGAVEELMERGPVLPMRFGTTLADEHALREVLVTRGAEFKRSLELLRGRVEMAARAVAADRSPERPALDSGRDYMLVKLQRSRQATRVTDELHPRLAHLAVSSARRVLPTNEVLFAGSYLVERGRVGVFRRQVETLDRENADADVVCTGPWPPYSFAGGGDG